MEAFWFLLAFSINASGHNAHMHLPRPEEAYHSQQECISAIKAELPKLKNMWGLAPDEKAGGVCIEGLAY